MGRSFWSDSPAFRIHWISFSLIVTAWAGVYGTLYGLDHLLLRTNGFDLSVFDYSLWSTLRGRPGYVPFFGHSLFAEHFMPTLVALVPVYAAWPSPVVLLVLELLFVGAAAAVLFQLSARRLPVGIALALTAAFLFSRRSHSALAAWFHIEALEPLLVFALVALVPSKKWWAYFALLVLLLGCKEDMTVYIGMFGAYLAIRTPFRAVGIATAVVSVIWLAVAAGVVIPRMRAADGLPRSNPFTEARYGEAGEDGISADVLAHRALSTNSVTKILNVTSSVGFLCWASPGWLVVALPGALANLAGRSDTLQAGLVSHYLWPLLPWVFLAAIDGAATVVRRWPRLTPAITAVLVAIVVIDSPVWIAIARRPWTQYEAAQRVREQLAVIPPDASLLCQASLIPHVPHRMEIQAIGRELNDRFEPAYVAVSTVGDLWPLDVTSSLQTIERFKRDTRYALVTSGDGPLFVFRRR